MSAVMLERDAVMAAARGPLRDALGGRGGTLFVAGEAGLGKTTVLRHAAAAAGTASGPEPARPTSGRRRCRSASSVRPSTRCWTATRRPPERPKLPPTTSTRCWLAAAAAASQPLFLALDDAHWADPDSLTLLRLICRRITELPACGLTWMADAERGSGRIT